MQCSEMLKNDIIIVTLPTWERYLNWVYDTTPPSRDHGKQDHPPPPRNHGKENLPPPEGPRKLPRKMRPRRRQGKHQFHRSSQTESQPGTSRLPRSAISAPVKHPRTFQRPQHPQPPGPAANHFSGRAHLQDHPESGRLYKPARSSMIPPLDLVETTSPGKTSHPQLYSDLIETTSLGHPLGLQTNQFF